MTTFDESVLGSMNRGVVERLLAEPLANRERREFSSTTFAFWALVFPPVGLLHALRAAG